MHENYDGGEMTELFKGFLVVYAGFWGVYFIYLLYISIMFMAMAERFMKDILQYSGKKLCYRRFVYFTIGVLFNIGQCKFFLINGIVLIIIFIHGETKVGEAFKGFQGFTEYCETLLPLILGIFLIYIIEAIGFVDEEEMSQVVQTTQDQLSQYLNQHNQSMIEPLTHHGGSSVMNKTANMTAGLPSFSASAFPRES